MAENFEPYQSVGGQNLSLDGGLVASVAGTQPAVTGYVTRISGTNAIVTLSLPYPGFQGTIVLIPTGIFTWTAAGNIGLAGTAVVGKALHMTYLPATGKWYPNYIA
jgi:hypothetical protein